MTAVAAVVEHNARLFRRTWVSTVVTSVAIPALFLGALGLGLGSLVTSGRTGGGTYLAFLAPGLMTSSAMQTAVFDMSYPIMGRLRWDRTYDAVLATRARVDDIVAGELCWLCLRLLLSASLFFSVAALFGAVHSALAAGAVLAAMLTGLSFGAPMLAFTATQRGDKGFNVVLRFVVMPLFLLGGAFFPVDQLPRALQGIAWLTPLSHGVALARDLWSGSPALDAALLHLAVVLAFAGLGVLLARRTMTRRLRP